MTSNPSSVAARLSDLVARGTLRFDARQAEAAQLLDIIGHAIVARESEANGLLGFLRKPSAIRGAYLVGEVGRGKTLLMDLFFASVPIAEKRRVHFHEFMDEMHEAITAFRHAHKGKRSNPDPIAAVVKPIIASTKLLCLDEFQVGDITNAMLLQRLFEKLFAAGVVVVSTSNVVPRELYKDGLNRQLFLPFIDLLEDNVTVFALHGATDYRRLKFEGQEVYHFGAGPEIDAEMDRLWLRLTGGEVGAPESLALLGRSLQVPRAAMGAARFDFADLCEQPLGARDYLRLTHAYDALMIDHVPQFERTRSDASKRFILLVDALYDRGIKLLASFAVPLDQLGADQKTRFEFGRCVSRLIEMQSADYLNAPRKAEGAPGKAAGGVQPPAP